MFFRGQNRPFSRFIAPWFDVAAPVHDGGLDRSDEWDGLPPSQHDGGSLAKAGARCPTGVFHDGIIPHVNGKSTKNINGWLPAVFGGMDSAPAVSPAPRTISISSAVGKMTQAPPAAAGELN